jgi:hypothetical protein
MRQLSRVTMTMRELDRLKCLQAVVAGELPVIRAAEGLGMSARQIRRWAQRYRGEGPVGLISRRCRRPSNNHLKNDLEARVAGILRERYADFGPTLAAEKLAERHQIVLAKETVRRIQIAAGLWIPRKLRAPKIQQPRARRGCVGELIQIDGCEHRWFEDRAPMCTVLVYVDDATSRLMVVHFTGAESTFAYFEATREYLGRYGKPLALYSDKASIFRVNSSGSAVPGPPPGLDLRSLRARCTSSTSMGSVPTRRPPRGGGAGSPLAHGADARDGSRPTARPPAVISPVGTAAAGLDFRFRALTWPRQSCGAPLGSSVRPLRAAPEASAHGAIASRQHPSVQHALRLALCHNTYVCFVSLRALLRTVDLRGNTRTIISVNHSRVS